MYYYIGHNNILHSRIRILHTPYSILHTPYSRISIPSPIRSIVYTPYSHGKYIYTILLFSYRDILHTLIFTYYSIKDGSILHTFIFLLGYTPYSNIFKMYINIIPLKMDPYSKHMLEQKFICTLIQVYKL